MKKSKRQIIEIISCLINLKIMPLLFCVKCQGGQLLYFEMYRGVLVNHQQEIEALFKQQHSSRVPGYSLNTETGQNQRGGGDSDLSGLYLSMKENIESLKSVKTSNLGLRVAFVIWLIGLGSNSWIYGCNVTKSFIDNPKSQILAMMSKSMLSYVWLLTFCLSFLFVKR